MQVNKIELSITRKIHKLTKLQMKISIYFCGWFLVYFLIVKLLEFFQSSSIRGGILYLINSVLIAAYLQPL